MQTLTHAHISLSLSLSFTLSLAFFLSFFLSFLLFLLCFPIIHKAYVQNIHLHVQNPYRQQTNELIKNKYIYAKKSLSLSHKFAHTSLTTNIMIRSIYKI